MKNKTLAITKVLLKSGSGLGIKTKRKTTKVLLTGLVGFAFLSIFVSIFYLAVELYQVLAMIEQQGVLLGLALAASSLVILMFGITYIISSFYFSADIENFLPLPIKPKEIIGAKFLVTVIYEYLIAGFIMVPVFIVYGIKSAAGPLYYLYSVIIFSLIPIVPLIIAAVIVMVIMRFTNLSKHKDLFKTLSGVLGLLVGLGVNFAIQRFQTMLDPAELEQLLLAGNNSLSFLTSRIFPTVKWAVEALLNYNSLVGLFNLVIFVGISILLFVFLLYFGEWVYIKGVIGLSETGSRRKNSALKIEGKLKQSSVLKAYTMVELKLLFRTPIYFLNCVLMNFLWPLFLIFPLVLAGEEGNQAMALFRLATEDGQYNGLVIAIALGIISFIAGTNGIAATAISREGQGIYVKKYIPVSYRQQITAKVLSSMMLGGIGVLTLVAFAAFILKLPFYLVIALLALGWMPLLFSALTGILIDLFNPKLDWDTEQRAVKQNFNVVYSMVVSIVFAAIVPLVVFFLRWNFLYSLLFAISFYGVLNLIMYKLVYHQGVAKFHELAG